ncbi:hypothetical protein PV325_012092 [Microctonus aethiopoides]|nr:hypothetical protein PV325_012092 [Microctonus aethiopoides]
MDVGSWYLNETDVAFNFKRWANNLIYGPGATAAAAAVASGSAASDDGSTIRYAFGKLQGTSQSPVVN